MDSNVPIQEGVSQAAPGDSDLAVKRKNELLMYVQSFYRRSWDWRSQGFHTKWDQWDRNCNGIYDPQKAAQKEPWQSTMFVDVTSQNVEVIAAQIFKTLAAPNPPIQTEAGPDGDALQARLIQDIIAFELQKANFNPNLYDAIFEAIKYGSGFMKFYWDRVEDTRMRRVPVNETPMQVLDRAPVESLTGQAPMPPPGLQGFQMQPVQVLLKNFLCAKYIHIRDIFPEPNTTIWDKVIHRDKITYGEICKQVNAGAFFDVKGALENVTEGEKFEADLSTINQELGYFETNRSMSKFEKRHTVWELWCPIPRKWIDFEMPDGDEAETLVPGKVMVASGAYLLSSEINYLFDGEPPILKIDFLRVGKTYGRGIPEKIKDDQEEINEVVNLGIDNLNLIINKGVAVIEEALVNPEADLVVKPGWVLRLRGQQLDGDVKKGMMPIDFPDLATSYFRHRFDIERSVQEKTGASRVTLASSDTVKDTNQTLGGMELLKQMFNERIAANGMCIESDFMIRAAYKIYSLIYQNLSPEELKPILGDDPVQIGEIPTPMGPQPMMVPRYLAFTFPPPELVNQSYTFKVMGVFSMENKIVKAAQFMDWYKLFAPFLNPMMAAKHAAMLLGNDEADKIILPFNPMMLGGGGMPSPDQKETPGMKGGPNGNGATFGPKDPLARQPVVQ